MYVNICPRCRSKDVYRDYTVAAEIARGAPSVFTCKDCGFSSTLEIEVLEKSKIKKIRPLKVQEERFERGFYRMFLYAEVPFFFLIASFAIIMMFQLPLWGSLILLVISAGLFAIILELCK